MIAVFAGAGASMAVNKDKYPGTVGFFEQLPKEIKNNNLFKETVAFLRKNEPKKEIFDIEEVLFKLKELIVILSGVKNKDSLFGHICEGNRIIPLGSQSGSTGNFIPAVQSLEQKTVKLITEIEKHVFQLYFRGPEENEITSNWIELFHNLPENFKWEVFTTNYDTVIEASFEHFKGNSGKNFTFLTGREASGGVNILNENTWPKNPDSELNKNDLVTKRIRLSKLHGSIDWSYLPDKSITWGSPQFTGHLNNHVLIAPGFKDSPENGHELLARKHKLLKDV